MQNSIQIAPLRLIDIDGAFRLAYTEGWNQTKADWRRLLEYQPKGCFGAHCDDRLVGTVTTSIYGELAWLGMMLVQREYRGLGIGRNLMLAALDYARAERVSTMKLDATRAGRTLYEALDFVPEAGIERWEKGGTSPQGGADSVVVETTKMNEICKIDRQAFGADRATMLKLLSEQSCAQPLVVRDPEGDACGYAMARPGSRAIYVGPIVSTNLLRRYSLLDSMVGQFAGRSTYVDLYKGSSASSDILLAKGFVKQRDLTRMYWGRPSRAGLSPSIFAIAGPEIG